MEIYEAVIILNADLSEEDRVLRQNYYRETFTHCSHMPARMETWGVKRLAYPIKGHAEGDYLSIKFAAEREDIDGLEEMLYEDDTVLKFIIVRTEDKYEDEKAEEDEMLSAPAAGEVNRHESDAVAPESNDLFDLIFGKV